MCKLLLLCIFIKKNYLQWFLNLGGQSGPVESKSRWPGGKIRWPWANGPVLMTSLMSTTILCSSHSSKKQTVCKAGSSPISIDLMRPRTIEIHSRLPSISISNLSKWFKRPRLSGNESVHVILSSLIRGMKPHFGSIANPSGRKREVS